MEMPLSKDVIASVSLSQSTGRIWQVPYKAGTLKAVAYEHGKTVAVDEVHTAGVPAQVRFMPDRTSILGDGYDLSYITVRLEDKRWESLPPG